MTIFVDSAQIPLGRMKMAHMVADTTEELEAIALKIGLDPKHIEYRGLPNEHVNVSQAYRTKALKAGAVEMDSRGLVKIIQHKRKNEPAPGILLDHSDASDTPADYSAEAATEDTTEEDDDEGATGFAADPAPPKRGGVAFIGAYPTPSKNTDDE